MTQTDTRKKLKNATWAVAGALGIILLAAAATRWINFAEFPPGLWYDEAYTLVNAQRLVQGGDFQWYYPDKHGEPGIIWLSALALKLGAGHLAPRWVTSIFTWVSIALIFFAVRDIMRKSPKTFVAGDKITADCLALGSAGLLTINYAYTFYSRMSWQTPLCATLCIPTLWFLWRGLRDGQLRDFAIAGLMAGLSQYTSVSARMLPLAALLILIGFAKVKNAIVLYQNRLKGLVIMGMMALLIYLPLLITFIQHPSWFNRRMAAAVNNTSSVLPNLWNTLAGWLWMGGAGIHSLPGRPIYDPIMGIMFIIGASVALWHISHPQYNVWLAWFIGCLAGGILSSPAPMFYRILPAVPAASVLCAFGMYQVWAWITQHLPQSAWIAITLLTGVVIFSLGSTLYDYFIRWAQWDQVPYIMDTGKWRAAEVIQQLPIQDTIFVTIPSHLEPTIAYAIHTRSPAPQSFNGQHCLMYPAHTAQPIHYIIIQGYEHRTLSRLQSLFPEGQIIVDPIFEDAEPYFVTFSIPAIIQEPIQGQLSPPITYGPLELAGAAWSKDALHPKDSFSVTLTWQAKQPIDEAYTVFVHVLDPSAQATHAPLLTQHDSPPCMGSAPTYTWPTGLYIVDEHPVRIPDSSAPGNYLLSVGVYHSTSLERLPSDNQNTQWGQAILGTLTVTQP